MGKINKKAIPAIILIIVIMIVGFSIQFFSIKDSGEIAEANVQSNEYVATVEKCQAEADSKQELSKECQALMDQK